MHAPEPRLHTVRYYGAYSSRSRGEREDTDLARGEKGPKLTSAERRRMRRAWAQMIRRVYEVDPLLCDCGSEMEIISFINEYRVVQKILDHVRKTPPSKGRAPPG